MKSCEHCQTELVRRNKEKPFEFAKRRFCNRVCFAAFRRTQAKEGVERFCKRCGKKLVSNPNEKTFIFRRKKTCSKECPALSKHRRKIKICKNCGSGGTSTYCSRECRKEFWDKIRASRPKPLPKPRKLRIKKPKTIKPQKSIKSKPSELAPDLQPNNLGAIDYDITVNPKNNTPLACFWCYR